MSRSAVFFRAANILTLDYPYAAAIQSALAVVDEACIVVGQSQDATRDAIYALQDVYGRDRVQIRAEQIVYDRGWQERWWQWCTEMTTADWRLWLDLDEVIPPAAHGWLQDAMTAPTIWLVRFPFVHFYATAYHTGGFSLTHNTRLGRAAVGYRMVNLCSDEHPDWSACAARFGDGAQGRDAHGYRGPGIVECPWPILHYGWCRDAQALAISQAKHYSWYANGNGLQDGHVPDVPPYAFRLGEKLRDGWAKRYAGTHPPTMRGWLDSHAGAWVELMQEAQTR